MAKRNRYELRSTIRQDDEFEEYEPEMEHEEGSQSSLAFSGRESQIRSMLVTSFNNPLPFLSSVDVQNGVASQSIKSEIGVNNFDEPPARSSQNAFDPSARVDFAANLYHWNADGDNVQQYEELQPYSTNGYTGTPASTTYNDDGNWNGYSENEFIANNFQALQDQLNFRDEDVGLALSQNTNNSAAFMVYILPQKKATNKDYVVAENTLFTKYRSKVPFSFNMSNEPANGNGEAPTSITQLPQGSFIRASLKYSQPEYSNELVKRCPHHRDADGGEHKDFIINLTNANAVYDFDNLSITIPACPIVPISFECFSSCAGGIDRKSVNILFELLNQDREAIQSVSLHLKVCANPGRDAPKMGGIKERARVKSEFTRDHGAENDGGIDKKAKKRRKESGEETNKYSYGLKRSSIDSLSPMNRPNITPSPSWMNSDLSINNHNWNTSQMSAPKARPANRRITKMPSMSSDEGSGRRSNTLTGARVGPELIDDDEVYTIKVKGYAKYKKTLEYVKILEKNDRYENRHELVNPLRNLSQMTTQTSIRQWLEQEDLGLDQYADRFEHMGVNNLGDLEDNFSDMFFMNVIGMDKATADMLNSVFLNWSNVCKADRIDMHDEEMGDTQVDN